ncbi:MAG: two component transcriptional regulator, LuxR family [uncultured bacterium]|nr:MAG: two component transcriptional regulator, LuxR family [uncultured bacterium]
MSVSIAIADDHDVIREGIKNILSADDSFKIIGEFSNGEEVLANLAELKPDILLLDISMPVRGGLDIVEQVNFISPLTSIIIITVHRTNIYINKAFKLGVKGYIQKENVVEDLIPALKRILRGENYISSGISEYLIDRVSQKNDLNEEVKISDREEDILRLVVEGKTAKEIASLLYISPRTVENYKNNLMRKLNLHKSSELIKYAIKHKLVENLE